MVRYIIVKVLFTLYKSDKNLYLLVMVVLIKIIWYYVHTYLLYM